MKILLASHFFPPTHTGGTETRTLGYALELSSSGHEVQVVCAGNWERGDHYWAGFRDEVYQSIPVRRIDINWTRAADPNRYLYDNPIIEEHIFHWLEEWQPDIVHITSCVTLSASIIRAVKRHDLPLILTLTDFWFICPRINLVRGDGELCDGITTGWDCLQCKLWDSGFYRSLDTLMPKRLTATVVQGLSQRPALNRLRGLRGLALNMEERKQTLTELIACADILTAPSTYLGKVFSASGVAKPILTIHSGHDLSWLKSMPKKNPADKIRFGYIGQLIPIKGVHTLIAAFSRPGFSNKAQLSIYGSPNKNPSYSAKLQALARDQNISVRFLGEIPHERLGEAFANIDILIVPSVWHENNPRIIQEAFASKTPVIATNVGGISEFVTHTKNGLLYQHEDEDGLAAHIENLIANPGLIEQLTAGIPDVKTMRAEIKEFVEIYTNLVDAAN